MHDTYDIHMMPTNHFYGNGGGRRGRRHLMSFKNGKETIVDMDKGLHLGWKEGTEALLVEITTSATKCCC